ncbi:MAG: N-carbamoyl-L-amino-acid hydrolase [Halobacteriales archaeon]|jgi:N-carbamoyl-L-amino-acid hydrolase
MNIDAERLRKDIEANGEHGAIEIESGHGRTALTGTEANRQCRDQLVERMEAAELEVRIDAVGNVVGRWVPTSADPDLAPIATGSHLDSVPKGGIFDGPLGVYASVESVRAMQDSGFEPDRPIEVVSFTEEEGQRFGGGMLGSAIATGQRSVESALGLEDDQGITLEEALESIGYRGDGRLEASDWDAWLELHVEQDTTLETEGVPVGIVTTITGIAHYEAVVEGEANHAGATAMDERRDALVAASEVVRDVEQAAREVVVTESPTAVATVGRLEVRPNATNVVPGRAELGIDLRDVRRDTMDRLVERVQMSLNRVADVHAVDVTFEPEINVDPVPMSDRVRDVAHRAADQASIEAIDMPSGAAHDTMHVAEVTDATLLFAPSSDGMSHSPAEWTDWEDCAEATSVLAGAIADLTT